MGDEQAPLGALAWEVTRLRLAERFGWRLHEVDALSYRDALLVLAVAAGGARARSEGG